jgi:hypothetical protein
MVGLGGQVGEWEDVVAPVVVELDVDVATPTDWLR